MAFNFAVFSGKTVLDTLHNDITGLCGFCLRKRLNIFKRIINAKILIFYFAHVVVRKNIERLDGFQL